MITNPLAAAAPAPSRYPRTSRYFGVPTAVLTTADGRQIPYTTRRLLPQPGALATIGTYQVREGDRLDVLSFRQLRDPEQWWRLADANPALDPRELTDTPGRRIRVTLPEGVPGPATAG